jgi:hypothetical protein
VGRRLVEPPRSRPILRFRRKYTYYPVLFNAFIDMRICLDYKFIIPLLKTLFFKCGHFSASEDQRLLAPALVSVLFCGSSVVCCYCSWCQNLTAPPYHNKLPTYHRYYFKFLEFVAWYSGRYFVVSVRPTLQARHCRDWWRNRGLYLYQIIESCQEDQNPLEQQSIAHPKSSKGPPDILAVLQVDSSMSPTHLTGQAHK